MKKSIKNFENKTNVISNSGMNKIKGGVLGKPVPPKNVSTSSGDGHVTIIK